MNAPIFTVRYQVLRFNPPQFPDSISNLHICYLVLPDSTISEMDLAGQIAYNANMTDDGVRDSDLLGLPLPGGISLSYWRATIKRRGSAEVLAWRVAKSPAPPASIASGFVSLPRPVPPATIKSGTERLRQRLKGRNSGEPPGTEELLAAFREAGVRIQLLRQVPPGEPPFFGGEGALDDFIGLADQPREAIRAFADHWGPLGICKHLVPWTHSLARRSTTSMEPVCSPLGVAASQGTKGWEPLDKWQDYSREAKDITRDAITLKNDRARSQDQLERLFWRMGIWLELAAVPFVTYADVDRAKAWPCGFQATFAIAGVFQILALQLLGVVAGGRQLAQCSHCGLPFLLTGHREGNRHFCPTCVDRKVPMRYAARDYRTRQRKRRRDSVAR
jgi:hypothetical protein